MRQRLSKSDFTAKGPDTVLYYAFDEYDKAVSDCSREELIEIVHDLNARLERLNEPERRRERAMIEIEALRFERYAEDQRRPRAQKPGLRRFWDLVWN